MSAVPELHVRTLDGYSLQLRGQYLAFQDLHRQLGEKDDSPEGSGLFIVKEEKMQAEAYAKRGHVRNRKQGSQSNMVDAIQATDETLTFIRAGREKVFEVCMTSEWVPVIAAHTGGEGSALARMRRGGNGNMARKQAGHQSDSAVLCTACHTDFFDGKEDEAYHYKEYRRHRECSRTAFWLSQSFLRPPDTPPALHDDDGDLGFGGGGGNAAADVSAFAFRPPPAAKRIRLGSSVRGRTPSVASTAPAPRPRYNGGHSFSSNGGGGYAALPKGTAHSLITAADLEHTACPFLLTLYNHSDTVIQDGWVKECCPGCVRASKTALPRYFRQQSITREEGCHVGQVLWQYRSAGDNHQLRHSIELSYTGPLGGAESVYIELDFETQNVLYKKGSTDLMSGTTWKGECQEIGRTVKCGLATCAGERCTQCYRGWEVTLHLHKASRAEQVKCKDRLSVHDRHCVIGGPASGLEDEKLAPLHRLRARTYAPYEFPELDDSVRLKHRTSDSAVCFSGGGARAFAAAIGQIRALHYYTVHEHIRYYSGVGGGAIAATAYLYRDRTLCPTRQFLGEFLWASDAEKNGVVVPGESEEHPHLFLRPGEITLRELTSNAQDTRYLGAAVFEGDAESERLGDASPVSLKTRLANAAVGYYELDEVVDVWQSAVDMRFLKPYGIDGSKYLAWCQSTLDETLERNPNTMLRDDHFMKVNHRHPYPIIGSTLISPYEPEGLEKHTAVCEDHYHKQFAVFESTPLACGVPIPQQNVVYHEKITYTLPEQVLHSLYQRVSSAASTAAGAVLSSIPAALGGGGSEYSSEDDDEQPTTFRPQQHRSYTRRQRVVYGGTVEPIGHDRPFEHHPRCANKSAATANAAAAAAAAEAAVGDGRSRRGRGWRGGRGTGSAGEVDLRHVEAKGSAGYSLRQVIALSSSYCKDAVSDPLQPTPAGNVSRYEPPFLNCNTSSTLEKNDNQWISGDGTMLDGLALIPILRRKVKNIVLFVNSETPLGHTSEDRLTHRAFHAAAVRGRAPVMPSADSEAPAQNFSAASRQYYMDRDVQAYFGLESPNDHGCCYQGLQCFETTGLWEMLDGWYKAVDEGRPVVWQTDKLRVLENKRHGVRPYTCNVTWFYLAKAEVGCGVGGGGSGPFDAYLSAEVVSHFHKAMSAREAGCGGAEGTAGVGTAGAPDTAGGAAAQPLFADFPNYPQYCSEDGRCHRRLGFPVAEVNLLAEYTAWSVAEWLRSAAGARVRRRLEASGPAQPPTSPLQPTPTQPSKGAHDTPASPTPPPTGRVHVVQAADSWAGICGGGSGARSGPGGGGGGMPALPTPPREDSPDGAFEHCAEAESPAHARSVYSAAAAAAAAAFLARSAAAAAAAVAACEEASSSAAEHARGGDGAGEPSQNPQESTGSEIDNELIRSALPSREPSSDTGRRGGLFARQ